MTATTIRACPEWCTADHGDWPEGAGVFHEDTGVSVTIAATHGFDGCFAGAHVWVSVGALEDPEEAGLRPLRVNMFAPGNNGSEGDNDLSADEADHIARALLTAADRLREIEARS
jgi:hypothetical protein